MSEKKKDRIIVLLIVLLVVLLVVIVNLCIKYTRKQNEMIEFYTKKLEMLSRENNTEVIMQEPEREKIIPEISELGEDFSEFNKDEEVIDLIEN